MDVIKEIVTAMIQSPCNLCVHRNRNGRKPPCDTCSPQPGIYQFTPDCTLKRFASVNYPDVKE